VQNLWSNLHSFLLSINLHFSYSKETVFFGELTNLKKKHFADKDTVKEAIALSNDKIESYK
jgi:hypothetical protein